MEEKADQTLTREEVCEECEKEGICEAAWCGKKIYCGFCDSEEYFNGNEDDWCRCGEHPSTSRGKEVRQ